MRFLRRRTYELSQIQRLSLLQLPLPSARLDALQQDATAFAGGAYMVTWEGPAPEHWLADLAVLFSRMETDAPRGTLVNEPEVWDTERMRAEEARHARSGRLSLTTAAVHQPTGRLAGLTRLSVPTDRLQPVRQQETLVLREHRGHRLGLLMKLVNLRQLTQASPDSTMIVTGNAEDNQHMLAVNEAIGFVPVAYQGAWKKTFA